MVLDIGRHYWKNRDGLIKDFRNGKLRIIDLPAINSSCYFCTEQINDEMVLLVRESFIDDVKHIERYCSCMSCFEETKTGIYFFKNLNNN